MNKRMPDDVYATLSAVVEKYPHTGTDDERREAMKKVVATIRARHGLAWTWKTEHQSLIAPSKDGLGYVADGSPAVHGQFTQMFIFDTINGGTRRPNAPPMMSEEPRPAYVVLVTPQDWLADAQPTPPPEPTPEKDPGADAAQDIALRALADVVAQVRSVLEAHDSRIATLERQLQTLTVKGTIDVPVVLQGWTRARAQGDVEFKAG